MPTPKQRGDGGAGASCGSRGPSAEKRGVEGAVAARALRRPSGREEACEQRSAPQDVTSSWARRGGVNLQQEVAPQQTERPPRDSPVEDTPDRPSGAEMNIQADGAGRTAFRGMTSFQPAPLLNLVVGRHRPSSGISTYARKEYGNDRCICNVS